MREGRLKYDLGLSVLYWRKLRDEFLSIPTLGTINFHPALLPEYKGTGGYNLAIMDELNEWGNTAHYVDASIDTGEIIEVDRFPIDAETETAQSLERKTMQALEDFARRIITRAIESKTKLPTTPNIGGRYVSRDEMEAMKQIHDGDNIEKKIRAFWFPPYDGAYVEINGQEIHPDQSPTAGRNRPKGSTSLSAGKQMLNTSLSPWPSFTQEEADAVSKVLLSNKVNYWTGTECREFEKEFAAFVGTQYAVALSNGTLALDVALKAMGIGQGDDVIVTSRTFLASRILHRDRRRKSGVCRCRFEQPKHQRRNHQSRFDAKHKAIIVVHLAGMPAEMDDIMALAKEHNLWVIEDCAQAHGAKYKGKSVGSIGHVGAWSFCQDKIMTTGGEGGMVTTNDKELWSKMWSYKDHGKSYDAVYNREHAPGFRWLHESFGTNWRMLEMQAVIGRIQLKRMPEWTARRQRKRRQTG